MYTSMFHLSFETLNRIFIIYYFFVLTCRKLTILHPTVPKNHDSMASWRRVGGRHMAITKKSATARLTRCTLVNVLRFLFLHTAKQTNKLPTTPSRKMATNSAIKIQCSTPGAMNSRISRYHSSSDLIVWFLSPLSFVIIPRETASEWSFRCGESEKKNDVAKFNELANCSFSLWGIVLNEVGTPTRHWKKVNTEHKPK